MVRPASFVMMAAAYSVGALKLGGAPRTMRSALPQMVATAPQRVADEISKDAPLKVLIAGAGVGGLALANQLELSDSNVEYTVLECAHAPARTCDALAPRPEMACLQPIARVVQAHLGVPQVRRADPARVERDAGAQVTGRRAVLGDRGACHVDGQPDQRH
jgi:isopentenyl phosphate kinase